VAQALEIVLGSQILLAGSLSDGDLLDVMGSWAMCWQGSNGVFVEKRGEIVSAQTHPTPSYLLKIACEVVRRHSDDNYVVRDQKTTSTFAIIKRLQLKNLLVATV
jgi:hypothetical protein